MLTRTRTFISFSHLNCKFSKDWNYLFILWCENKMNYVSIKSIIFAWPVIWDNEKYARLSFSFLKNRSICQHSISLNLVHSSLHLHTRLRFVLSQNVLYISCSARMKWFVSINLTKQRTLPLYILTATYHSIVLVWLQMN